MSQVGTWVPDSDGVELNGALVAKLLAAAGQLDDSRLGLSADEVARLAPIARRPRAEWRKVVEPLVDADLVALIRFFTLAEERLANWESGAQSPVIAIAAELRQRGRYPKELTAWIRAHSQNRFLPWGSLADRL